jgi:D-amino-acid dehydrogenase
MPPVVFEDRSLIVTRFRSHLRACSFVEFARIDDAPDARKWSRLRAHVAALGIPFTAPVTEWMGARPTLPDYLPAVGRSRTSPAICYAFGHQHLGLTLAAITAECVTAMFLGEPSPVDLEPFDLERFGSPQPFTGSSQPAADVVHQ